MPPTPVEWRVCCETPDNEWMAWRVRVYCRAHPADAEPGPWQLVRDTAFRWVQKGAVPRDYWKHLVKAAAQ